MIHASRPIVALCAACLVVALGGCAPRVGSVPPGRERPDPSHVDPIADTAEQSLRDYVAALARTARETAEAAPSFKAHADAADYGAQKNKAARDESFRPVFQAIDDFALEVDPKTKKQKPYDATKTAAAFRSFAQGIERPIKPKP